MIKDVLIEVLVYAFHAEKPLDDRPEKSQRVTQWLDGADAAALVNEGGLAGIIEHFAAASIRLVQLPRR